MATSSHITTCPVCRESGCHVSWGGYEYEGRTFDLMTCSACASIFVLDPVRTDYTIHTADELAIRDYVELNAAIDIIGANVLTALANQPIGRLLDIGCGFGFGADVARRLAGWDVTGVEPSTYGRRGAEILGLRIYHDYLDAGHPLTDEKFDAIFSSEVIEHVDDPRAFLAMARSMLSPGGLLVIGTPDAASLSETISEPERLAVLSPGAHLFIMSQRAMRRLLTELGFTHIEIVRRGTSMVAYAGTAPFELATVDPIFVGRDYARAVLRDGVRDDSLRMGLTFRLFRYLIDLNELDEARAMIGDLPAIRIDPMTAPKTMDDYMAAYPANVAPLVYYRAMLKLNGEQAHAAAAEQFLQAYLLCATKLRLAPALAVVEANLLWASLYHAAVSFQVAGDGPLARALWQSIISSEQDVPAVWKDLSAARLA